MKRTALNLIQGTEIWLKTRAESDGTASEAPAMFGKSKYQTRTDLLTQRKTGLAKEVDSATQAIFNKGHEAEAKARKIAEKIIGEELSPVTYQIEVEGLILLASLDGITFDDRVIFEHKLWNEKLAEQVKNKTLDEHYTIQLDQELLASGAEKCLFMVSDGTEEKMAYMWYETTSDKTNALVSGWKQFKDDLDAYVPPVVIEKVEAETIQALPVPSVVVRGEITASNLSEITPKFDAYLGSINTQLSTDQDFANAEANAKNCRGTEKRIEALRANIIAQMVEVNEVDSALANYQEAFRKSALQLEKAVKEQKELIKTNAIMKAQSEYITFVNDIEKDLPFGIQVKLVKPNFAEAIKGIKTIESMHSRLNDAVAKGKTEATALANDVKNKLAYINEATYGYEHLFAVHDLAFKDIELIKLQIQSVKDAEDKRKAEYEAQIKAKAEADALAMVQAQKLSTQTVQEVTHQQNIVDIETKLPERLDSDFKHIFEAKVNTKETDKEIITRIVAGAYGISEELAYELLVDTFGSLQKAA